EYVPGYRKVPGVIYARRLGSPGFQRLQHGLRICQYGRARKPGMEGATATFLARFTAHAAGHDACTGFCRGIPTRESLKSRMREVSFCKSVPAVLEPRAHFTR